MTQFVSAEPQAFERALELAQLPDAHTFIDGEFLAGSGEEIVSVYPGDGREVARVRAATAGEVAKAAQAAKRAQQQWADLDPATRARILNDTADLIVADLERLAHLIAIDNGKPVSGGKADVLACVQFLRSAAGWATRITGTTLPLGGGTQTLTWREPVGVVGVVMPFNAPFLFCGMKIAPAIAMGNTVVAKTPEKAPLPAVAFCQYVQKAGAPAGVVNLVHGCGDVGAAIVEDPNTDMISFTGSSVVGAKVGARANELLKYSILELGGKSANIVYADAPYEAAVAGAAAAIFRNAGQRCFSGSRLLVEEEIADQFIADVVAFSEKLVVGDPLAADADISALIDHSDVARVQAMVDRAVAGGAIVRCGGKVPEKTPERGAFYLPTVIEVPDGADCAEILAEEVFGPVLVVQRFNSIEQAIEMANDSQYGLAGGCWTNNLSAAMATARGVNTGMFWINAYGAPASVEATIGGRKRSGIGTEKGREGMEQYTVVKTVVMPSPTAEPVLHF